MGGIRQIPPMVEIFVLQLSEFLLLLASFPILLLCNKPREVLLAVLVVTLMAALWQKLCITCFHSILLNITFKITIPVATTSHGQETILQRRIQQLKIWLLSHMIKNRLGRQPQGRRVTNEFSKLEL